MRRRDQRHQSPEPVLPLLLQRIAVTLQKSQVEKPDEMYVEHIALVEVLEPQS